MEWDTKLKVLQANTFVTYDMLSERQMEIVVQCMYSMTLSEEERKNGKLPRFIQEELKMKREQEGGTENE